MSKSSKITIHMVASLDGYIAKRDGDISWLHSTDRYDKGVELSAHDIETFLKSIDCYVMGSHTYEHALKLGWPYGDVQVFVLTHRDLASTKKNVRFISGDLDHLVNEHLKPVYSNIWMVGGAVVTKDFMRRNLADELVVSIMPVVLGDGIPFFDRIGYEKTLHLKDVTPYKDGMVELTYEIKKQLLTNENEDQTDPVPR